jgi:uncharacterized protein
MNIRVGEVIAVNGVRITLRIDDDSNRESLFFNGEKYKGISIREYISIQRGFRDIVCMVEGEHLDENRLEQSTAKTIFIRRVDARPIGYFESGQFKHGVKYLPMIKDSAFLLKEDRIRDIFGSQRDSEFSIGKMLKEEVQIGLPWKKLFNSHIGIFGNTGSGKSNTLAKLYSTLFEQKAVSMGDKSRFIVLDFNGEYSAGQLVAPEFKAVYKLSTQKQPGVKIPIQSSEFWNVETLAILFQATNNTQKPFLNRLIEGRNRYAQFPAALTNFAKNTFRRSICAAGPKPDTLDLLRNISRKLQAVGLSERLKEISWHNVSRVFFRQSTYTFFNADEVAYEAELAPLVDALDLTGLDAFDELIIRAQLQLTRDLIYGHVQFEHIQPLLKRIESSLFGLKKVLDVGDYELPHSLVTVISLKKCSSEIKKVLPLLLAKHFYNEHKDSVEQPPNKTIHLIVDEAHNILSQQSTREAESWKDYRLELFEEIVKEGRKFGVFLTVASQRPADISPTIVSQLHNFFIHRLVNDRDLFLVDNSISTLDSISRALIPTLAQGCCVLTGTAFDLPMVVQVDALARAKQPDSEDVDLEMLWSGEIP